jgi:hypothetical protein
MSKKPEFETRLSLIQSAFEEPHVRDVERNIHLRKKIWTNLTSSS